MLELGTSSLNTLPSTGSLKCWNKTYGGAKQHEARGQIIRDVIESHDVAAVKDWARI
ncbi:hypothetical protein DPMN_108630 [Dreissena polymorpha]|uniref:Uncharacterized protein n=1 Tax=Dreissena polymorpha TaxID=45954 RepID=A0A9D4K947_DREPO|nr:hypothetical protein DPMN_108630 [Dreissena polymorpha]